MICTPCLNGNHQHSTWTGKDGRHPAGSDAGCPRVTDDGLECACPVILPLRDPRPAACPTCGHPLTH